jgi:hypothetical protein
MPTQQAPQLGPDAVRVSSIMPSLASSALTVRLSIVRNGTRPSIKGPASWFTGSVRIDCLFQAEGDEQYLGGPLVTE